MDPNSSRLLFNAADGEFVPPVPIGAAYQGGYVAGYISHTANDNATHGLIVAPASTGYNNKSTIQWKTTNTFSGGAANVYNGAPNTASIANTSHPAANYCAGLTTGGYSDWYLPSLYELTIAYYNLKPTTTSNVTYRGDNPYSVPKRDDDYSTGDPAQTSVTAFQSGGSEAFVADWHWTSLESDNGLAAWIVSFSNGNEGTFEGLAGKTPYTYVRAFRKFAL